MSIFTNRVRCLNLIILIPFFVILLCGCRTWHHIPRKSYLDDSGRYFYNKPAKKSKVRVTINRKVIQLNPSRFLFTKLQGRIMGSFRRDVMYRLGKNQPKLQIDGYRVISRKGKRIWLEIDLNQSSKVEISRYSPGRTASIVVPSVVIGVPALIFFVWGVSHVVQVFASMYR